VYNLDTPMDFELAWKSVIEDFGLQNNKWLSNLLYIRDKWIHAYLTDLCFRSCVEDDLNIRK